MAFETSLTVQNVLPHRATIRAPFDIVFGKKSTEVRHIRPFECRAAFSPPIKNRATVSSQTENRIHVFHEVGVIYLIETSNETVIPKNVKFVESKFPGSIPDTDFYV